MLEGRNIRTAVVVGAGPVGCLSAIALAKQGWNVEIYEGRPGARRIAARSRPRAHGLNYRPSPAVIEVSGPAAIHKPSHLVSRNHSSACNRPWGI